MLDYYARQLLEQAAAKDRQWLIGSSAAILLASAALWSLTGSKKDNIPFVPYTWPIIGSTVEYNKDKKAFTKKCHDKYGPVFRAHLFGRTVTVVGLDHAAEVFTHPSMSFNTSQEKKFQALHFFKGYAYTMPKSSVMDAIVKELNPKLKEYTPRSLARLNTFFIERLGDEKVVKDVSPLIAESVAAAAVSAFFGDDVCQKTPLVGVFMQMFGCLADEFQLNLLHQVLPWYHEAYMKYYYPRMKAMKQSREAIRAIVDQELKKRFEHGHPDGQRDFFQWAMDTHIKEHTADNVETLTTFVEIFFFVGVMTTVATAVGLLQGLLKRSPVVGLLRQEQEQAIADEMAEQQCVGKIDAADEQDTDAFLAKNAVYIYRRLVKLDSMMREGLRFGASDLGHAHTNTGDAPVVLRSGAVIQPGEEVYISLFDVHYNYANKDEKPLNEFDPFRHVHGNTVTKVGEDFVTFGLGKHACPGRWFATHQIKGVLTSVLRHYDIADKGDDGVLFTRRTQ
ncbi:cytochrome P450 [Gongronella butleri]|nr:cytochrome P450 [Gongronella butleri]